MNSGSSATAQRTRQSSRVYPVHLPRVGIPKVQEHPPREVGGDKNEQEADTLLHEPPVAVEPTRARGASADGSRHQDRSLARPSPNSAVAPIARLLPTATAVKANGVSGRTFGSRRARRVQTSPFESGTHSGTQDGRGTCHPSYTSGAVFPILEGGWREAGDPLLRWVPNLPGGRGGAVGGFAR